MLKAGSEELIVDRGPSPTDPFRFNFIPSFGDLDGDGDEDMVVGLDGLLYFYKNVGSQGYPVFVEGGFSIPSPYNVDPDNHWVSPAIGDLDGDLYGDLIIGQEYWTTVLKNPGVEYGQHIIGNYRWDIGQSSQLTHLSYTIMARNGNNVSILMGSRQGEVWERQFEIFQTVNGIGLSYSGGGHMISLMNTFNYSAPRRWQGQSIDNSPSNNRTMLTDVVVGSGVGTMNFFRFAPGQQGGPGVFNLVPNYFQNIDHQGPITPAPFDLDGDTSPDLVLGTRDTYVPEYINYNGEGAYPPYWAPTSTVIPPLTLEDYHSVFDRRLMVYNESSIEGYLDSIISPIDARYRDELGFACAYTPPEMLYNNGLANIFNDNAYYIYSRDSELEYVSLKDYDGDDYYTTASYWVNAGGTLKQMEIPMDAYYWGLVHLRITEEMVAYVDPENGGPTTQENGGRFWREYIYEHADDNYPPGPEYPADYTGRYVYYPKDFAPPLLKEELKGVDVLWDLQPYEYPGGFNDAGTAFNYPTGHKVHAIEKVSQWVERTLPLNQQESLDQERPNQPVRIAHTHNGNCGELQDLTVAAARCALIPARGVNLPGEDHAWSEFYCGGWQQWDNYWSDGGGVVANDMTYWWGWGKRGGSGIYASLGTGETLDVGDRYRSPDVQGKLTVRVVDSNGVPVDGARVVLLSHWMMNNVNVDVGPYQGPPPVTVPFPSIWGYTDDNGTCTLSAWQQEFNLRVISEMGQYYLDKFTITSDEQTLDVELQGNMASYSSGYSSMEHPTGGKKYLVSAEVLGSIQHQTQFLTRESYLENVMTGKLMVEFDQVLSENRNTNTLLSTHFDESNPYTIPLETGDFGVILSFLKWGGIKTIPVIRIKVFEVVEGPGTESSFTLIANPLGERDKGFSNGQYFDDFNNPPQKILGFLIGHKINITGDDLQIAFSDGTGGRVYISDNWVDPYMGDRRYDWAVSWWTSDQIMTLDAGIHSVKLLERTEGGDWGTRSTFEILVHDIKRPVWEGSFWLRSYSWGSKLNFSADLYDPQFINAYGWLDSNFLWTAGPSDKYSDLVMGGSVDSSKFGPGGHQLRLAVLDRSDNLRTISFPTSFVPNAPLLNITSPSPGYRLTDDQLVVRAQASDDVELISLTADVNGTRWDLFRYLDGNGFLETVLDLDEVPGPLTLKMTATDNVGLVTESSVNFTLQAPPDTTPPIVEITDPSSGKKVTIGDLLTVRGRAMDEVSLAQLKLQSPGGIEDLLPQLKGTSWSIQLDTSSWSEGSVQLTARGIDQKGNIGSDQVTITSVLDISPFRDRADPVITVSSPSESDPVELGTTFTLVGTVEDDGTIERFELSLDMGEGFDDITSSLGDDGSFSVRIDTASLPGLLSLEPVKAKDVLGDYRIYLMARDSAGKVSYLDRRLELRDTKAPYARLEMKDDKVTEGTNKVSIDVIIEDGSAPGPATISLINDKGRTISVWEVPQKDFVLSEGEWKASTSRTVDLGPGEYEMKAVLRDVFGNTASTSEKLVVDEGKEGGTLPFWFYFAAGGGGLLLLCLFFFSVSLIISKMEKKQKRILPDDGQTTKV